MSETIARLEGEMDHFLWARAEELRGYAKVNIYNALRVSSNYSALAETMVTEKNNQETASGYRVKTTQNYAKFVEFGTIYQTARPFFTLAVQQLKIT